MYTIFQANIRQFQRYISFHCGSYTFFRYARRNGLSIMRLNNYRFENVYKHNWKSTREILESNIRSVSANISLEHIVY